MKDKPAVTPNAYNLNFMVLFIVIKVESISREYEKQRFNYRVSRDFHHHVYSGLHRLNRLELPDKRCICV